MIFVQIFPDDLRHPAVDSVRKFYIYFMIYSILYLDNRPNCVFCCHYSLLFILFHV